LLTTARLKAQPLYFLSLLLGNSIYLNFFFFKKRDALEIIPIQSPLPSPLPSPTTLPTPSKPATISPSFPPVEASAVKDYFIPLGSGTNQSNDWVDVPGIQTVKKFILRHQSIFLMQRSKFGYGSLIKPINTRYGIPMFR